MNFNEKLRKKRKKEGKLGFIQKSVKKGVKSEGRRFEKKVSECDKKVEALKLKPLKRFVEAGGK